MGEAGASRPFKGSTRIPALRAPLPLAAIQVTRLEAPTAREGEAHQDKLGITSMRPSRQASPPGLPLEHRKFSLSRPSASACS